MHDTGAKWFSRARHLVRPPDPADSGLIIADDPGTEMMRHEANVHGAVACQMSEVMQGNLHRREDLVRKLAEDPAAGLEDEIFAYDALISSQVAAIDRHLDEARRLRGQAAWRARPRDADRQRRRGRC
jgi:hypothetical protein